MNTDQVTGSQVQGDVHSVYHAVSECIVSVSALVSLG